MRYFLAIDIGASSGRHILGHIEDGRLITEELYRFANGPVTKTVRGREALTWDIDLLEREIIAGLAKAAVPGKIPEYVGIDTWGVDYVLLDGENRPIDGAYCYRDSRTDGAMAAAAEKIGHDRLFALTGIQPSSINTVYQLYDDLLTGRLSKARRFLMLPDYFHYRLTGRMANEYTNATTTGMIDTTTHSWSTEILSALGIPAEIFAEPTPSGSVLGKFSPEVAEAVGYNATVILPATHDTASAVLAAPLKEGTPYISSGTWSLLGVERPMACTTKRALDSGYSNEGGQGGSFRLQKNIMGLWMLQSVRRELLARGEEYDYPQLEDMGRRSPISDRVSADDSRFLAPKSMIGEIEAAVGRSLTVGELSYCICASLAEGYLKAIRDLEDITGRKFGSLNIFGGGSKNSLLNRLTADLTGLTIITGPKESTAIGNLIIQMIGSGELESVKAGRELVARSFEIKTL